jgi:hypothetical protein
VIFSLQGDCYYPYFAHKNVEVRGDEDLPR